MATYTIVPDSLRTGMILPVSKKSFFNTIARSEKPLCLYDMVYHPPDYNPKAKRSDRTEQQIIQNNIWIQELPKPIPSTTQLQYGRPYWPIYDKATKEFARRIVKCENPEIRLHHVLEWAVLLEDGKPSICT